MEIQQKNWDQWKFLPDQPFLYRHDFPHVHNFIQIRPTSTFSYMQKGDKRLNPEQLPNKLKLLFPQIPRLVIAGNNWIVSQRKTHHSKTWYKTKLSHMFT